MDLYYTLASPPCHAVLMAGKALGVELNLKNIDFPKGDHMTPEFRKMNPQHTIPTLDDHGFYLCESRAIMIYLSEKYAKNALYPTDPQRQAIVNQRLQFDMGTLYQRLADYYYPIILDKQPGDPEKLKKLEEALGFLNTFLDGHKYAAGDELTLADISLVATVSVIELMKEFDVAKYPNIERWYKLAKKTIPGYSLNEEGIKKLKALFVD